MRTSTLPFLSRLFRCGLCVMLFNFKKKETVIVQLAGEKQETVWAWRVEAHKCFVRRIQGKQLVYCTIAVLG